MCRSRCVRALSLSLSPTRSLGAVADALSPAAHSPPQRVGRRPAAPQDDRRAPLLPFSPSSSLRTRPDLPASPRPARRSRPSTRSSARSRRCRTPSPGSSASCSRRCRSRTRCTCAVRPLPSSRLPALPELTRTRTDVIWVYLILLPSQIHETLGWLVRLRAPRPPSSPAFFRPALLLLARPLELMPVLTSCRQFRRRPSSPLSSSGSCAWATRSRSASPLPPSPSRARPDIPLSLARPQPARLRPVGPRPRVVRADGPARAARARRAPGGRERAGRGARCAEGGREGGRSGGAGGGWERGGEGVRLDEREQLREDGGKGCKRV